MNTLNRASGVDRLANLPLAQQWLRDVNLLGDAETLTERHHRHLVRLRETLRDALDPTRNDQGEALDRVNGLLRWAGANPALQPDATLTVTFQRNAPPPGMAAILGAIVMASIQGQLRRLKICANPECRWAYFDPSRNASARWCDMATCGNRAKVSRYRRSHEQPS